MPDDLQQSIEKMVGVDRGVERVCRGVEGVWRRCEGGVEEA
jgi:hypothetical protein